MSDDSKARSQPPRESNASTEQNRDPTTPPDDVTTAGAWYDRLRLFAPVDVLPLVCFRIFFGLMMLYHVYSYLSTGTAEILYITPKFHFTYTGFSWVQPWPGQGTYIQFGVMGLAAFGILTGSLYRISAIAFALCFTHAFLTEKAMYQNHYYLICLISAIMIFIPAHRTWSVDAWWRPAVRSDVAPRVWLWLLRAQLAIPYIYGGIAKINSDWLHGMPMRMWLERRTWMPGIGPWLSTDSAAYCFAWGGLIFDLLIVPALLWRRTRMVAYIGALSFHLANSFLWTIGIFPWFMIGATLLFFPAGTFRHVLFRRAVRASSVHDTAWPRTRKQRIAVTTTVGLYLTWQLLFPFRHFLYPGNSSWTEEAIHFSWHMMLREKRAGIRISVTLPDSSERRMVDPTEFLHPRQIVVLSKDPDMIAEFTRFIRHEFQSRGEGDVEIHVAAFASLNGRNPQLIVDPTLDYAQIRRTWGHQPWIVPLHKPLQRTAWDQPMHEWEGMLAGLVSAYEQQVDSDP